MDWDNAQIIAIYRQHLQNMANSANETTDAALLMADRELIHSRWDKFTEAEKAIVGELDSQMVKMAESINAALLLSEGEQKNDRSHWWWFLHERPQVRQRAR